MPGGQPQGAGGGTERNPAAGRVRGSEGKDAETVREADGTGAPAGCAGGEGPEGGRGARGRSGKKSGGTDRAHPGGGIRTFLCGVPGGALFLHRRGPERGGMGV
ncbi:MAG: hypothetical protein GX234_03830 [Clostridiales bacterium]|nr:hypothetical protein [Clostridiales bacterium]